LDEKAALSSRVNFGSVDPLTSRSRFKSRTADNLIALVAVFVLVVFVLSALATLMGLGFGGMLLFDAIAVGGVWYFYNIWQDRPIQLECLACRNIVSSSTPWVCGFCKQTNINASEYPFVDRCSHCGAEPKSYKCHHCGELIYLSEDHDPRNYAYCLNSPKERSGLEKREEKMKVKRQKLQKIELEISEKQRGIVKAQLDARLKEIKKSLDVKRQPTLEAKKEELAQVVDSGAAVLRAANDQKARHKAEIKNAAERRRVDLLVDQWVERELTKADDETE
jgi:outer membrane murein-binding lipoprotein Lpp